MALFRKTFKIEQLPILLREMKGQENAYHNNTGN